MTINGAECDTYTYLDDKETSETVVFKYASRPSNRVTVYLFANNKPFPVDKSLYAYCCATDGVTKTMFDCEIGDHGEVIVPFPNSLYRDQIVLRCEINVTDSYHARETFRYRAANFRVAMINQ